MSTRRQVLRTLSLGLLAWPLRILAERQGKVWRVGVLAFPRRPERLDVPVEAQGGGEIEGAFSALVRQNVSAFILTRDRLFYQQWHQVAEFALRHRLPSMGSDRYFPSAGGLMSHGQNVAEDYRRTAVYVDKLLRGTKAADLPVEQPTKLELVLNRRTARALGMELPAYLLALGEKVIE